MGAFDEVKKKGQDLMDDADKKAKIEQMAKEKGISIDEAKSRFMKNDKQ